MVWEGFSLRWYSSIWEQKELLRATLNSLIVGSFCFVISFVLGIIQAYVLVSIRGPLFFFFSLAIFLPLLMPDLMIALPISFVFSKLGISKGLMSIAIGQSVVGSAYVAIIIVARLRSINLNQYKLSSYSLGSTEYRFFKDIFLPLVYRPAFIGAILIFLISLQDFLYAFFCGGPGSTTLAVHTYGKVRFGTDGALNVLYSLILLVTWFFLLIGNKRNEKQSHSNID